MSCFTNCFRFCCPQWSTSADAASQTETIVIPPASDLQVIPLPVVRKGIVDPEIVDQPQIVIVTDSEDDFEHVAYEDN